MKVSVKLTYAHCYFVRFPHTSTDIIAHLLEFLPLNLFVFVIQSWSEVYHEVTMKSTSLQAYINTMKRKANKVALVT